MRILVINGPNLAALGRREQSIYGNDTLESIADEMECEAAKLGVVLEFFQSDYEGALIERIWRAADDDVQGIIINPGGYTHTSVALLDALRGADLPTVEVHLSNIAAREEYRHRSITAEGCIGVVAGFRGMSYVLALRGLVSRIVQQA